MCASWISGRFPRFAATIRSNSLDLSTLTDRHACVFRGLAGRIVGVMTRRAGKFEERIVSLAPNATSILFAIGARRSVVGVSKWCGEVAPVGRLARVAIAGNSMFAKLWRFAHSNRRVSSLPAGSRRGVVEAARSIRRSQSSNSGRYLRGYPAAWRPDESARSTPEK